MSKKEETLLNSKEVALMLGVSERQVFKLKKAGLLPRTTKESGLPGSLRWRLEDIRDM
jgi:predicted DNA-binding transcriptional regulator AlpA